MNQEKQKVLWVVIMLNTEDTEEVYSIEGYLNKIRMYLNDIIDKHKDEWKIRLAAEITFSSVGEKDSKEFYPIYMHSEN